MTRPRQILLLEDEPLLREMLALYLATQDYRVLSAGSRMDGEAVLRTMGPEWPDLVLADANLNRDPQVLEGYRFLAHWPGKFPVPPFIFLHAHPRRIALPGEEDHLIRHVDKPFHPPELVRVIRSLLPE